MTEIELFAAYRTADQYAAECACGDVIRSAHGDEASVTEATAIHNESPVHQQWRSWCKAVDDLHRPADRPCPCHDHGAA